MDMRPTIPSVVLRDGTRVPALGLGTWNMGEQAASAAREVAALEAGIELGFTLIDTAEMYGEGGAERLVARAAGTQRDQLFIVSKVYPHNASAAGTVAACERSLARLRTDRIDLYLLHWRGRHPLAETVEAFERLRGEGKILRWGVSNFDSDDVEELLALPEGHRCAVNQVLYNLGERGIEYALRARCDRHRIAIMAYSPLQQGALLKQRELRRIATTIGVTPAQLALAWLLAQDNVMAIPQSSKIAHVTECRAAAGITLSRETLDALDTAFPPPTGPVPLAML